MLSEAKMQHLIAESFCAQNAIHRNEDAVLRAERELTHMRASLAEAREVWRDSVKAIGIALAGDLADLAGLLAKSAEHEAAESVIGKPLEMLNPTSASAHADGSADAGASGGADAGADGSASASADAAAGEVDNVAAALAQTDPALQAVVPGHPAATRRVVYEAGYAPPPAPADATGPDRLAKAVAGIERELAAATPHAPGLPDFDPGALPATKRVQAWLTKHTGSQAVAAIAAGTKLPNMAVSRVLHSLQEQGLVTRIGRGHWARTVK